MPFPTRARIYPKGSSSTNSLLNNIIGRGSQAAGNAVSGAINSAVGGALGGELGAIASNMLTSALNGGGSSWFSGPASVLARTGGLVFPNTPTVTISHSANYEDIDMTHTAYAFWSYKNSKVDGLSVTGRFTSNTRQEADYVLGAIHFLRAVTKMHYGANDPNAGVPPPVMLFEDLGPDGFNAVPVVITNFTPTFAEGSDRVVSSSGTFVPIVTDISVSMQPYYNPTQQVSEFSLEDFKSGSLLPRGYI